ncbi:hypothetical protein BDN67DRAFT_971241 [Paxillus ammoniavirescens]|nr:hypothetical protein BDN67DRAFT_971241 [Paxillus ammoniavirescens]
MAINSFETYTQGAEQDESGTGDLPTYDDLAAQSSPNSRFGRWRGWIEKRAAERYANQTPEEMDRRRTRGWGLDQEQEPVTQVQQYPTSTLSAPNEAHLDQSLSLSVPVPLRIRINEDLPEVPAHSEPTFGALHTGQDSASPVDPLSQSQRNLQGTSNETLIPSHLQVHQFGSRFLPHTTSPIRCILPIQRDRLLLIGTDSGLSVLDTYPTEWASDGNVGIIQKGPGEAQERVVWAGEAVYQLSILEYEDIGEGTPQGVVLALVGPDPDAPSAASGHQEPLRSLRMYNLASLTSLAKWTIAQQGAHSVDLRRASDWNIQQTPVKKHRPASSITRGLKNLIIESPTRTQQPATSYQAHLSAPAAKRQTTTASADSSWDVVDDLPLRWATDFVPLASAGSRLASSSVIAYALWQEGGAGPGGGRHGRRALLAVATKSNIFLYETPKGERAFHFVKEFYTPVAPRNLTFAHQSVQDTVRPPSDNNSPRTTGHGHTRATSSESPFSLHNSRSSLAAPSNLTYSAQMVIFIVFEKKAGLIRIADAAVTEVELYDTGGGSSLLGGGSFLVAKDSLSVGGSLGSRRSRASIDFMAFREGKGSWVLPTLVDLPATQLPTGDVSPAKAVYVLTRGKQSHIVSAPLPPTIQSTPPIYTLTWSSPPSSVSPRVCVPSLPRSPRSNQTPPFLQLIGMGEDGIEVLEIPLTTLWNRKGKGKGAPLADPRRVQSFIGETGFLANGGHWHHLASVAAPQLERTDSTASAISFDSVESEEATSRLRAEAGVYGWLRKDVEDWRVFWVGGDARDIGGHDEDEDGVLV